MINKDKLILVYYVQVGSMSIESAKRYLLELQKTFSPKDNDYYCIFIVPIKNGDTKIECLNPRIIKEDDELANEVLSKLEEAKNKLDIFLKS